MSGIEAATLVRRIDDDIEANRQKIEAAIVDYFSNNVDEVAQQILMTGVAKIPTFAGDFIFTEEDIRHALKAEQAVTR